MLDPFFARREPVTSDRDEIHRALRPGARLARYLVSGLLATGALACGEGEDGELRTAAESSEQAARGDTRCLDGGAPQADAGRDSGQAPPVVDAGKGPDAPASCRGIPLPPRAYAKKPPFSVGPLSAGLPAYWPTADWRSESADKLGFDADKLAQAVAFKTPESNTQAVLVIRHGYIAAEKYFGAFGASTPHESYSMAKSFTSGLVGIAIAEGKLSSVDEKVCAAYPAQWSCDDASDPRSRVTVDHAMNLMTGLAWQEDWRSTKVGQPNDAYAPEMLERVLARKAVMEPGLKRRYSTGDPALLSGVLQKATGMTAYAYAKQKIFDVIGTPGVRWSSDSKGRTNTYANLKATAREYAKYGYLYLNRGRWDGAQVVPAEWVDRTTRAVHPCEDWNQNLWHVNLPVRLGKQDPACDGLFCLPTDHANLPADGFFAEGVAGQFIFVVPSEDLVIVRLANDKMGSDYWDDYARGFLLAVMDALR